MSPPFDHSESTIRSQWVHCLSTTAWVHPVCPSEPLWTPRASWGPPPCRAARRWRSPGRTGTSGTCTWAGRAGVRRGKCTLYRDVARLKSLQNSGAFQELFWVLSTLTEKFCAILKNSGVFRELFLGAFEKYVEILCYFWELFQRVGTFGSFLGRFWPILKIAQIFCAIFCPIFWKLLNSGDLPKFGSRRQLCYN